MRNTHYHEETSEQVRNILENAWERCSRVRIWYGNTETGTAWDREYGVTGYIGRSTGEKPIPLLIHNNRCYGGGAILDDCIIRIDDIRTKRAWYKHPQFNTGLWTVTASDLPEYGESAVKDGEVIARFKRPGQAQRYIDFMTGKRYNK